MPRANCLHIKCDYRLIIDNLMDLSHLTFVHPGTIGSAANVEKAQIQNELTEDSATVTRWLIDIEPPPTYARAGFKGNIDRWQIIRFEPPAFVNLYAGATDTGTGAPEGDVKAALACAISTRSRPKPRPVPTISGRSLRIVRLTIRRRPSRYSRRSIKTFLEDWEVLETQQRWNELTARLAFDQYPKRRGADSCTAHPRSLD